MPDADALTALGQKLTAALISAYSSSDANAALVFLPGGITVPNDIVQTGMVNPAQMGTFLQLNFDSPFVISPSECAVHGRDSSHGTASEIYMIAASSAQPFGSPSDPSWKRINAEIAAAQRNVGSPLAQGGLVCEPDDWVLPSNTGYWTTFDSTQTQAPPPPPPGGGTPRPPIRIINPHLWAMRIVPQPAAPAPQVVAAPPQALHVQPAALHMTVARAPMMMHPIEFQPHPPPPPPSPPPPPPPSTSITVSLQHQCVTLGYLAGGVPWWDSVFLSDSGWYIPGMSRGALLPAPKPTAASTDLAYGLPVALIVVQGLTVSGNWSGDTGTITSLGPFSLQGAIPKTGSGGTITLSRPGMQVIGLLCSQLPVLPPADEPAAPPAPVPAATPQDATQIDAAAPAQSTATPPASTPPPAAAPADATQPGSAGAAQSAATSDSSGAGSTPAATPADPAPTGTTTPSA